MVSEPLWRSERCKRKASSIYQASKAETSSESLPSHGMKRKKDMTWENSSKQSTSGTVEACEGEEDEITSPEIKIIRMRVHAYKALFQKQEKKVKVSGPFRSPPTLEEDLDNSTDGRNEATRIYDPQRRLHQSLQHKISRICEVLNLGDKVNNMTEEFLDYVINNHLVTQEPATILQAFQLALCWTAASILKVKVDHKESLQLVQTHMSYGCKKEEADIVYTMLCGLKKTFLERRSNDMGDVEDSLSSKEDVKEAISNAIKKIKKEYGKQMEKLMQQQKKEIDEVRKAYEAEKAALDNKRQVEAAIIRLQYREGPTRTDKLNILEGDMTGKIEECKNHMTAHLNKLDRTLHASRTKLHLKEFSRIISMKEWAQANILVGENAQTSGGPNGVEGPDDPTNINVCNLSDGGYGLSESPCDAAVSSCCESPSEGLVDHDPHNCISEDPCVGDGVNSLMACDEVSLDRLLHTASCANDQADRVTPLPNREAICPHSETTDFVSQNVQHLQSQIPDRTIADEATEMIVADETANVVSRSVEPLQNQNPDTTIADKATEIIVADDFTSVVEQDISGTPNDQASHPNEFGDSTPVQPLVTCASAPVTVFPEEPHDQPNGSCTLRTTQGEIAPLIEQLNACGLVSSDTDATPPDQHDSAELTPSVQDLSRVDTTAAYLSLEGYNSMSSPATRPFEEVLEPQMNSVSGQWTGPPGFENTLLSSFPLQTEIEKINKEEVCRMRDLKNLKMELNLECQKEIEHSVAQIHLKYKTKKQEAEELYKNKTKELEVSRHQVYMSKILAAAAFRLKYMDFSTTVARSLPDLFSEFELPQSNQASFPSAPPSTLQTSTALSSAMTSTMQLSVNPVQALPPQLNTLSTLKPTARSGAQTSTMQQGVNPVQGLPAQPLLCHSTRSTLNTSPALSSAQTSTMRWSVNPVQGLPAQQLLCQNTPSNLHASPALSSAQTSTMQQSVNSVQGISAQQLLRHISQSNLGASPALSSAQTSTMRRSVNPVQEISAQRQNTPSNLGGSPALSSAQASTMPRSVNPVQGISAQRQNTPSNLHTSSALFSAQSSSIMRQSVNLVQQLQVQQLLRHITPSNLQTSPVLSSAQTSTMQQSVNPEQGLSAKQQLRHNAPSNLHISPALFSAQTSTTMQQSVNPVQGLSAQQQLLRHNAPIRASTPRPSPVISQFTAPVNVQVCGNKRGPATHLQPNRPRPSLSPSPASLPPRGTYQPVNLPPSTSSHRTVSVSPGAVELLRGQLNPIPQMNSMGQPPEGSSSNIVGIRSRRGNGAAAIQVDSSQIVCLSDDDDDK